MVTKISLGKSLYGALAYNGEKINKEQGRLLATNRIFNRWSSERRGQAPLGLSRVVTEEDKVKPHLKTKERSD